MENQLDYWRNRWEEDDIPWHHPLVCPYLKKHCSLLKENSEPFVRVFVPLCGKSADLKWLYDQGFHVVGLEASEKAVQELFQENGVPCNVYETAGDEKVFKSPDERLQVFCSDLFKTHPEGLGKFDAVWDRWSLVALHPRDRQRYAELMKALLKSEFSYLLSTIIYDDTMFTGHPRNLPVEEISNLFGDVATVTVVEEVDRRHDRLDEGMVKIPWTLETWREIVVLLKPQI